MDHAPWGFEAFGGSRVVRDPSPRRRRRPSLSPKNPGIGEEHGGDFGFRCADGARADPRGRVTGWDETMETHETNETLSGCSSADVIRRSPATQDDEDSRHESQCRNPLLHIIRRRASLRLACILTLEGPSDTLKISG